MREVVGVGEGGKERKKQHYAAERVICLVAAGKGLRERPLLAGRHGQSLGANREGTRQVPVSDSTYAAV